MFKIIGCINLLFLIIGVEHAEGFASARPYAAALVVLLSITLDELRSRPNPPIED